MENSDIKEVFDASLSSKFNENQIDFILTEIKAAVVLKGLSPKNESIKIQEIIDRLLNDEPIQYIIGKAYFYDFEVNVNEHTLIPRPETEELVDLIIKKHRNEKLNILDIGTGSACIPIALAKHLPHSEIYAIDIDENTINTAKSSAIMNSVDIQFDCIDILSCESLSRKYDIIVSNPPYIPHKEIELMENNVLAYEPEKALFVNDDNPLIFYQKIGELSMEALHDGGWLYFECNEFNASLVVDLMKGLHFKNINLVQDFQGKDRMLEAQK